MRRLIFISFFLILSGCWGALASTQREHQLACAQDQQSANPSSLKIYWDCNFHDYTLPPQCLQSDAAARSPQCTAIVKADDLHQGLSGTPGVLGASAFGAQMGR